MTPARHKDDGFTLAELLVAMMLLAVILAISFTAIQVAQRGRDVSDRQAAFAQEVAWPLSLLEKTGSQVITIVMTATPADYPYAVSLFTDKDNDDVLERNDIMATPDGRLIQDVWLTNSQLAYTTHVTTYELSTHNVNRERGIPLFTYRTAEPSSAVITTDGAATITKNLVVTVASEIDGEVLQDSRTIYLRNR